MRFLKAPKLQRVLILITASSLSLIPYSSNASVGGTELLDNTFTVGFTFKDNGVDKICSGALIGPRIIVTAAHCVVGVTGTTNTDFVFDPPGARFDDPINPKTAPKVKKIYKPITYKSSAANSPDDIAFIELDRALATKGFIKLAAHLDVEELVGGRVVNGYGYGSVFETGAPYSSLPRKYPLTWALNIPDIDLNRTVDLSSSTSAGCTGDSGGPITAYQPNGEELLVAVLSGAAQVANACGQKGRDGFYHSLVTVIEPYLGLVSSVFDPKNPAPILKITCIKGKVKKVIKGVEPKCPKGYRLKK